MLTATFRLGATRAKAGALRNAMNIGVAAIEELGGDDHDERPSSGPEMGDTRLLVPPPTGCLTPDGGPP
jgi:hypothetical protein